MTPLLITLWWGVSTPVLAQEDLPEAGLESPAELSEMAAVFELRRADTGFRRKWLRRAGGSGVALASVWWLVLGDSWNAGDVSTILGGLGLVAAGGAVLGGSIASVYMDESELAWEAGTPTLSLTPTIGGSSTVGEDSPYGLALSASPRLRLSDGAEFVLAGTVHGDLGWSRELDPRPQGEFETALQDRHWGLDLEPEFRAWVSPTVQVRVRSQLWVRYDHYIYGGDLGENQLRRAAISPVMAGLSWAVSKRQRFWFLVGPRFDHLSWRAPDDAAWSSADLMLGPFAAEGAYEVHLPQSDWIPGRWEFHRRLRFRYVHSRFDGDGLNSGAMIGFFGPLELRYDLRARKPEMSWALQGALTVTLSEHGGVGLSLGVVPPRRAK